MGGTPIASFTRVQVGYLCVFGSNSVLSSPTWWWASLGTDAEGGSSEGDIVRKSSRQTIHVSIVSDEEILRPRSKKLENVEVEDDRKCGRGLEV